MADNFTMRYYSGIGSQGPKGDQGETGPKGPKGDRGDVGPYYTPNVDSNGDITWTNNGGLVNPDPVNLVDAMVSNVDSLNAAVETLAGNTASLESTIAEAQQAIDTLEETKDSIAETVASMAELGTDTDLDTAGMAADSKATGDAISALGTQLGNELDRRIQPVSPMKAATGSTIAIEDGASGVMFDKFNVDIMFEQSGEGNPSPDNVREIIGGCTGVTVTRTAASLASEEEIVNGYYIAYDSGVITAGGSGPNYSLLNKYIPITPGAAYTLALTRTGATNRYTNIAEYAADYTFLRFLSHYQSNAASQSISVTPSSDAAFVRFSVPKETTALSFTPAPTVIEEDWSSSAGEIYSGTMNILTGDLEVTSGYMEFTGTSPVANVYVPKDGGDNYRIHISIPASGYPNQTKTLAFSHGINNTQYNSGETPHAYVQGSTLYMFLPLEEATVEAAQAYFAEQVDDGTPVQVVWPVAKDNLYFLTPNPLETVNGVNNLTTTDGTMDVVYHTGTEAPDTTLSVQGAAADAQATGTILEDQGRVIFRQTVTGTKYTTVDADLPAGVYRLTVDNVESEDDESCVSLLSIRFGGVMNALHVPCSRGVPVEEIVWLPEAAVGFNCYSGKNVNTSKTDSFTYTNVTFTKLFGADAKKAWKEHIDNGYHELPKNPYSTGMQVYAGHMNDNPPLVRVYKEVVSTTHAHARYDDELAVHAEHYDHVAISNYYPSAPYYPMEAFYTEIPENFMISPNGEHPHFGSSVSNGVCPHFDTSDKDKKNDNIHICGVGSYAVSDPLNQEWTVRDCVREIISNLQFPQAGGATINHPVWSHLTGQDLLDMVQRLNGVFATEVHHNAGDGTPQWDYVLKNGVQLYGVAVPDHQVQSRLDDNPKPEETLGDGGGFGYNHCLVRARTEQEVLLAYSHGRFYSSNYWFKPESPIDDPADDTVNLLFTELKFNNGVFTVETNKNAVIKFITARSYNAAHEFIGAVQTSDGTGNSATYTPVMTDDDQDIFVRVEASASVTDPRGIIENAVTCTLRSNAVMLV